MATSFKQAVQSWVGEFNAISLSLITRAFDNNIDDLVELTTVTVGDYVYVDMFDGQYEVVSIDEENETVTVRFSEEETYDIAKHDVSLEQDTTYPMWGTMWTFNSSVDENWARENPEIMSECGFRLYEDQQTGDIYFGIDGAGYDFYEHHWNKLYRARGLQWHDYEENIA